MSDISRSLKFFRESKHLTKKEFCSGVVSASYYSKVENEKSNISADLLLEILNINNISATEFFFRVNNNKELDFIILYREIKSAYYNQDVQKLLNIKESIETADLYFDILILLINKLKSEELDFEIQEKIKSNLLKVNNWTEQYILLFTLATNILNENDLFMVSSFFIKSINKSNSVSIYETDIKIAILNIIYNFLEKRMVTEAEYFIVFSEKTFRNPLSLYNRVILDFYKNYIFVLDNDNLKFTTSLEKCKNIVNQIKYYKLNYTVNGLENLITSVT